MESGIDRQIVGGGGVFSDVKINRAPCALHEEEKQITRQTVLCSGGAGSQY